MRCNLVALGVLPSALLLLFSPVARAQDDSETEFGTQEIPDDESLETTDSPFPFFSHFMFGAGSGTMPRATYDNKTTNQSLYHLNLGIDVPFFIDLNYAIAVGVRVAVQYPTYLNIKEGEPTYHMAFAPNFEIYRNIMRNHTWDIDVFGGLTWNFRRSQYAAGTLSSNGPEIMGGTKARWLPYVILDSTPVVNLRVQLFGFLNTYSMTTGAKDGSEGEFEGDTVFHKSGDVSGYAFEISGGLSAPSSVAQTENEFLLGYFNKSLKYIALRSDDDSDVTSRFGAFFLAWRRTWVK